MKYILYSFILIISFNAFSQSDLKDKFNYDLNKIVQFTNSNEFSKILNFMNPKMFEIAPRSQVVEVFENMIDMGMKTNGGIARINHISDIIDFDNRRFCKIYYRSDMSFKISGQLLEGIEAMKEYFFSVIGPKAKDVRFDDKTNTFFIEQLQQVMIAEADLNSNNWYYIEFNTEDPQQVQILEYIFPSEVLEKLK